MYEPKESLNVTAKTVEDAIEQGLAQLGLSRQQVDIEVIKEGRRGVFGILAENAQVRLIPRKITPPPPVEVVKPLAEVVKPVVVPIETPTEADLMDTFDVPRLAVASTDAKFTQEQITDFSVKYLDGLLKQMGIKATVIAHIDKDLAEEGENPPLVLDITGNDLGILIGRRNETLRSLQYIVRLAVNKYTNSWHPILVDVESYRVRRRRSLQQLAKQMAERAIASRRRIVLEAMPPYERRIIHVVLKDNPHVTTKSIGSNDNRKVTIIPK